MESRLFFDSRTADFGSGENFVALTCLPRPSLSLQKGAADFYAALQFLQIDMSHIDFPDTVTIQIGDVFEEMVEGEPILRIVWRSEILSGTVYARTMAFLTANFNECLRDINVPAKVEYGIKEGEYWTKMFTEEYALRISWNVCRCFGFTVNEFMPTAPDGRTKNSLMPTMKFWSPGPIFCRLDCLEEEGMHTSGSETQFVTGQTSTSRRDSYLRLVEILKLHESERAYKLGNIMFSPDRLFWVRTARKEIHQITLSLTDDKGRLLRCSPGGIFYMCAEVLLKRRLALSFD